MNILYNLIVFTFMMGSLIGPSPAGTGNQYSVDNGQYLTDSGGSQQLFVVEDTQLHERVTKISNEIDNMLAGKAAPSEVQDDIFDEKFFAKERGKGLSGGKLEENERFVSYLKACEKVVDAYKYNETDLQNKIDNMEEARDLI